MQYLTKHNLDKASFEMLCLAVGISDGCGKCINAHELVLRENHISSNKIQAIARIVSIILAIANILRVIR